MVVVLNVVRRGPGLFRMARIGGRLDAFSSLKLVTVPLLLVILAAFALATLGHKGPDSDNCEDDADCRQDNFFVHEGVEELIVELGLFVGTGRVNFLNVHLQVCVWMIASKLLEPLISTNFFLTVLLVFKILQVLLDHIFRDLEALRNLYAVWQLEIVGQLNSFRKYHAFW